MAKLLNWLLTATCSAGILLGSKAYSQSYIQQDAPKITNQAEWNFPLKPLFSIPFTKQEDKKAKLNITTALDYQIGENSGTAYLDINSTNGYINKLEETWLIYSNFVDITNVERKINENGKWREIKDTAWKNATTYAGGKFAGLVPIAGSIYEIVNKVEEKQLKERKAGLESLLDFDEKLKSLLGKSEIYTANVNSISYKISFDVQRKQLEIETADGFVTGTFPSSRTNPADNFYAVFSLSVLDDNMSGKAENIGVNWRGVREDEVSDEEIIKFLKENRNLKNYVFKIWRENIDDDNGNEILVIGNKPSGGYEYAFNMLFLLKNDGGKLKEVSQTSAGSMISYDLKIYDDNDDGRKDFVVSMNDRWGKTLIINFYYDGQRFLKKIELEETEE